MSESDPPNPHPLVGQPVKIAGTCNGGMPEGFPGEGWVEHVGAGLVLVRYRDWHGDRPIERKAWISLATISHIIPL